jgi:phospholipid/cholesterol/gamma-HCH transport system substrate-binding protein
MTMRIVIRRYLRHVLALGAMALAAGGISVYILDHQRLRWPWEDVMQIEAEFSSAQSVTPGQGQTVNIAGVEVGEIGEVRLDDGHAVVRLDLEPKKAGPVYRNARLLLRPKTGLNDMAVQMDPGTPDPSLPDDGRLADGDRIPIENTLPNVNPDEVLAALDVDTRRYLAIVANAGGEGLNGRGAHLRRVLRAMHPTLRSTRRVMAAIADRRTKLRRLVTNLHRLSRATAAKDDELAELVDASAAVLGTLGEREADVAAAVERLPGALGATRRAFAETRGLAEVQGPALEALRPAARALGPALEDVRPLLRDAEPLLRTHLRPLVREATPLLRDLRPSVRDVNRATPDLVRVGHVLGYVANNLAYNPPGPEEGYLFWTSWFFHNAASILSIEDAHGVAWRGLAMVGCSSIGSIAGSNPAFAPLEAAPICPSSPLGKKSRPRHGERER